jgi:hypothetical protein
MPEEKTTLLCPACKTRMTIRQIAYVTAEDIDEFVYHCPMCDAEIKHRGPHLLAPPPLWDLKLSAATFLTYLLANRPASF